MQRMPKWSVSRYICDGPMRPDHAPTMEGESNDTPGYMVRGQIFAIGYMKGLIDAIRQERTGV
jgi:mannonate dehydratase